MAKKMMSPQEIAAKWQKNTAAAVDSFRAGVNAVTESPMEKAAQNVDKMVQGIQEAAADGRIAAGLRTKSLQDWKNDMLNKGAGRIAGGTANAQPKMAAFMTSFLPVLAANVAEVQAMPSNSLEDRIARSSAMQRLNSKFKFRKS